MRLVKSVPVLLDLRIREEFLCDIVATVDGGKVICYVDVARVERPASGGWLAVIFIIEYVVITHCSLTCTIFIQNEYLWFNSKFI